MDIRQLKYFVAIVEAGSFSKAAERLWVAQPSLSQLISGMEADLKKQLLIRSPKGAVPTEAGKVLYRHARTILRQMEQVREELKQDSLSESGPVALGLPTTIASVLSVPLYRRVRQRFPGIRLQIFESMSGYLSELLANSRLDLAFLFRDSESRGVSVQPMFDEELCVFGNLGLEDLPLKAPCPVSRLAGLPLALPSSSQGLRLLVERTFNIADIELNVVADIDSLPTLIGVAREGLACTVLPQSALALLPKRQWPAVRKLSEPGIQRAASLCWPNALPKNSATLAVRNEIVALTRELNDTRVWMGIRLRSA
jgi:LysR family nitrogen assimilation transcriptional regulator